MKEVGRPKLEENRKRLIWESENRKAGKQGNGKIENSESESGKTGNSPDTSGGKIK